MMVMPRAKHIIDINIEDEREYCDANWIPYEPIQKQYYGIPTPDRDEDDFEHIRKTR